eukprot:scaffold2706_cov415-Prasinococcus_capsulatus_cf.AAC.7
MQARRPRRVACACAPRVRALGCRVLAALLRAAEHLDRSVAGAAGCCAASIVSSSDVAGRTSALNCSSWDCASPTRCFVNLLPQHNTPQVRRLPPSPAGVETRAGVNAHHLHVRRGRLGVLVGENPPCAWSGLQLACHELWRARPKLALTPASRMPQLLAS